MPMTSETLAEARRLVATYVPTTPSYAWPLLARATGTELWVKHENHTPTGAFKVRGGLNFLSHLIAAEGRPAGLVSASRGNHSQSLAYAGRAFGVPVTIVVPEGNSPDKNAATEAFGAEVVVHGSDFQAAREYSVQLSEERGLVAVPAFHPWLVEGVATYAAELHEQVPGLDAVYVPVGMGSGVSANIAVRDLLGIDCEIVGVVADQAPAYALSYAAGHAVSTDAANTFVDGVACRVPDADAVANVVAGCSRIVRISEADAAAAMMLMFRATHNLAEPAGSLALAAVLAERDRVAGRKVAMILTGGNCDLEVLEAAARR
jgi:threonine dehydratase